MVYFRERDQIGSHTFPFEQCSITDVSLQLSLGPVVNSEGGGFRRGDFFDSWSVSFNKG